MYKNTMSSPVRSLVWLGSPAKAPSAFALRTDGIVDLYPLTVPPRFQPGYLLRNIYRICNGSGSKRFPHFYFGTQIERSEPLCQHKNSDAGSSPLLPPRPHVQRQSEMNRDDITMTAGDTSVLMLA